MPATLFVSDLHLDPQRPGITELFLDFLGTQGRHADALYILGDLFEAWIGDDDDTPLARSVSRGLHACTKSATEVFLMHGNRDFLLGQAFASACGASLIADPERVDLYGTPSLLMHGDLLCTADAEYLSYRRKVRAPGWQQEFLARPLDERQRFALDMRATSRQHNQGKPEAIMDVNPAAVLGIMAEYGVSQLIHGHTHRPGVHDLTVAGRPARRMVLGDWYTRGSVLECTPAGCQLQFLGGA